jgi:signal transduction histidine kinase
MNEPGHPSDLPAAHIVRFEELMAQELHDTVCQGLVGTSFLVNVLRRQAEAGQPVKAEDLRKVAAFLEQTMNDLRATVSPDSLTGPGLGIALEKLASEISKNVPCRVTHAAEAGPDDARTALVLYRLTRWAVRHAMKSVEKIFIDLGSADGCFTLDIHDGTTAVFAGLPASELDFLRQYAQTANIELHLDAGRRRLSARTPRS